MVIALLFWISVLWVVYIYLGYPVMIWLLGRIKHVVIKENSQYEPAVTLLIAAYNESAVIGSKLENCLALNYPHEKLQILIANDGSDDGTDEIVQSFAGHGVEMISNPQRQGKMIALKRGVKAARGEIVVMSDATNMYSPNTVRGLVAPFEDASVGVTSGAKLVTKGDGVLGESEGLYWRYESWIKKQETRLGCCINVTGEIYAFRKPLFGSPPDSIINDDFYMMMNIIKQGYRVVYTPEAHSWERVSQTAADEVERRARINAGRYQAISMAARLLPFNRPLVVWQVISHKFMRPLIPFGMIGAFAANLLALVWPPSRNPAFLFLAPPWNQIFFGLQLLFYFIAMLGTRVKHEKLGKWLYVPTYLVNSNWAALVGLWRFANRRQSTLWQRVQRREDTHG